MSDRYIHGFGEAERVRLIEQAEILAPGVFGGLDLSRDESLLEVGCAVGAELSILARLHPRLHLTGLDLSRAHLEAGRSWLADEDRIRFLQGNAFALPFADATFDVGIAVWLLEHVRDPARVVRELLRAVKPTGRVILMEVDNRTFGFDPPQPAIMTWWDAFNRWQAEAGGGDPYVGAKLRDIAESLGAEVLAEEPRLVVSSRDPARDRLAQLEYLRELLRSGAPRLLEQGYADGAMKQAMEAAFDALRERPDVSFQYGGVRLICRLAP